MAARLRVLRLCNWYVSRTLEDRVPSRGKDGVEGCLNIPEAGARTGERSVSSRSYKDKKKEEVAVGDSVDMRIGR